MFKKKKTDRRLTMQWIKEVETAKSIDELKTSRSIVAHRDFPDYDMLEEQRAQKHDRFLRGRQIAYMIYRHFRATGANEAVQGLSDQFRIRYQNDDVQDFVRWDQALVSANETPTEMILKVSLQV